MYEGEPVLLSKSMLYEATVSSFGILSKPRAFQLLCNTPLLTLTIRGNPSYMANVGKWQEALLL